ncbi:MAG: glycosyltransferase family 2 protein [Spirochaetota bacterium]|nr:glycosyltransferase family 2 protein [Spirochaetota bacterium]
MSRTTPRITVVTVTYHFLKDDIHRFLQSLTEQSYMDFELILVNNGDPAIIAHFEQIFPGFTYLQNPENYGFAHACNVAFSHRPDSDYFVLINPDTVVDQNWLKSLIDGASRHPDTAIFQSLILLLKDQQRVNTTGNVMHYLGTIYCEDFNRPYSSLSLTERDITSASGASMLIRRELIDSIGPLNHYFFLYYEDAEFSWRTLLAGHKIKLIPTSICYHDYIFKVYPKRFYYLERNRLLSYFSNLELKTILLFMPALIFWEGGMFLYSIMRGWAGYKLLSWLICFVKIPYILRQRRKIKAIRKVRDRDLLDYFISQIDFADVNHPLLKKVANPVLKAYFRFSLWLCALKSRPSGSRPHT